MTSDRRRFSRIPFKAGACFHLPGADVDVEVLDISLKGALIRPGADLFATVGTNGTLEIRLDGTDSAIHMETTIVHHGTDLLGLACREIDLDSVTHLRRLIELNLGDESILNREISALVKPESSAA